MILDIKKSILFIGGGIETIPGIEIAQSMGLHVIVSDRDSNAPCIKLADDFIIADTYNIKETLNQVNKYIKENNSIDGVICMATDVPLTVACVAKELKIAGISTESAQIVSDKILMKDCFKANRLPIPWYSEIFKFEELTKIINDRGYPLIIKPVDSRGARGVLLITENIDLEWAYSTSLSFSPSNRVMVEEYLEGPQVSTESLVIDGKVYTYGFSDRNYELIDRYAPHMIEDGGDLPSILSIEDQIKIKETVEKTAKALNVNNGVIKGDMVLSRKNPYIIEVALRLSGGYFCSHEIPLNTGIDFVRLALKIAMGETINEDLLISNKNKPVCQRYFFPKPGLLKNIIIPDWISSHPDISLFEIRTKIGDIIAEATHHPSRAGLVITTGKNRSEAINLAQKVVREVCFVTQQ